MNINAWGANERGQLAGAFYGPPEGPVCCVALPSNTVQVAGSYKGFTGALLSDGTMRMLGGGVNGQMGNGQHRASTYLPVKPAVSGIQAFAVAGAHVVALKSDGMVTCWGGNSWGTLGNGTSGEGEERGGTANPMLVPRLLNVVQVATGGGVVACLLADGTVRTWGAGSTGALGTGKDYPLKTTEGTTPQAVKGLSNVTAIAAGGHAATNHVLALVDDGTVRQWGAKAPCGTASDLLEPQVVQGPTNIVAVAGGPGQSFALAADGDLWAWGSNLYGQLFLPMDVKAQVKPVKVLGDIKAISCGYQYSLALTNGGLVLGNGRNDNQQLGGAGLEGVQGIFAGEGHAFAIGGSPAVNPVWAGKAQGGLEVGWNSPATTHKWEVTPSVMGELRGKQQLLPPGARSLKILAEKGCTMTIKVRAGSTWPTRTAVAVA